MVARTRRPKPGAAKTDAARAASRGDGAPVSLAGDAASQAGEPASEPSVAAPSRRLVVFACAADVGRAQIAALWFGTIADSSKARAICASSSPASQPEPEVAAVMKEAGLSLAAVRPRALSRQVLAGADLVVTMGRAADRTGIEIPGIARRREHWLIPALGGPDRIDRAREVRDLLRSRIAMLAFMEGWGRLDISREAARVTRPRRGIDIDGRP